MRVKNNTDHVNKLANELKGELPSNKKKILVGALGVAALIVGIAMLVAIPYIAAPLVAKGVGAVLGYSFGASIFVQLLPGLTIIKFGKYKSQEQTVTN
jgi:uncharacterized membrane protein YqgA involved in biofilm formation